MTILGGTRVGSQFRLQELFIPLSLLERPPNITKRGGGAKGSLWFVSQSSVKVKKEGLRCTIIESTYFHRSGQAVNPSGVTIEWAY
ncbi:hypothetical protein TorRG33x02_057710 [Trema orientale]|uniref:Uncharacterized protein n=1 Tax=Trema orientale TaxID=63057 RepID=A0A2P5FL64_TREOI|nr:hypothetical protein TorRG33x02_057710 [Trema orientale]